MHSPGPSMLALAVVVIGCSAPGAPTSSTADYFERVWSDAGAPTILEPDMVFELDGLPSAGEVAQIPWAASYWPNWLDSINHRWAGPGTMSPAEKFEAAFAKPGFADRVSAAYGVDRAGGRCRWQWQCFGDKVCAMRPGESRGRCMETWYGLCHAWAPAAAYEPEPRHPVTVNGVEFKVNDIKALVTLAYDKGVSTDFMALRCNKPGGGWTDSYGNPTRDECEDTNAGAFHLVVANLVGLQQRTFIEDRTFDDEVWNQPVRGYEVRVMEEVGELEAELLVGGRAMYYRWNIDAVRFVYVEMSLNYIAESPAEIDGALADDIDTYTQTDDYAYVLELDAEGRVLGGEWVGQSKWNHPDFLWLVVDKQDVEIAASQPGNGMSWAEVQPLLEASTR